MAIVVDAHSDILSDILGRRAAGQTEILNSTWLPSMDSGGIDLRVLALYSSPEYLPELALRRALDEVAALYAELDASPRPRCAPSTRRSENQVILRSGYNIAKQTGIVKTKPRPAAVFTAVREPRSWKTLIKEGSVQRLTVTPGDVGVDTGGEPYIDIYFGYLNAPAVGTSILGEENYRRLMSDLKSGEHAIFLAANGHASFKGSGFVRGGIYDRIQVA